MPFSLLDMAISNISMSSTSSSHDVIVVMIRHHFPLTTISLFPFRLLREPSRTSPPCRSQPSVLVMRAIAGRYDDHIMLCGNHRALQLFDRSVATVANLVGIAVKPDCHAPTMRSPKRKAPRAAEPKSSPSSERRKSNPILLL